MRNDFIWKKPSIHEVDYPVESDMQRSDMRGFTVSLIYVDTQSLIMICFVEIHFLICADVKQYALSLPSGNDIHSDSESCASSSDVSEMDDIIY